MKLLNKTAIHYWYTRNEHWVSKYNQEWASFDCNIQPVGTAEWFDMATVYKTKKLYCDYSWIVVWDKITVDGTSYIVKSIESRDGNLRKFYKIIIQESEWN